MSSVRSCSTVPKAEIRSYIRSRNPRHGEEELSSSPEWKMMLHMWPEARLSVTNVKTRWQVSEEVAKGTARAQDTRQSFAYDESDHLVGFVG